MELTAERHDWLEARGLTVEDLDGTGCTVRDGRMHCDYRDSSGRHVDRYIALTVNGGDRGFRWAPGASAAGVVLTLPNVEGMHATTVVVCEGESDGLTLWRHLRGREHSIAVLCIPGAGR